MSNHDDTAGEADGTAAGWPVELRGVTETVVATLGPNEKWNMAALGLHAPESPASRHATTWGTPEQAHFTAGGGVVSSRPIHGSSSTPH